LESCGFGDCLFLCSRAPLVPPGLACPVVGQRASLTGPHSRSSAAGGVHAMIRRTCGSAMRGPNHRSGALRHLDARAGEAGCGAGSNSGVERLPPRLARSLLGPGWGCWSRSCVWGWLASRVSFAACGVLRALICRSAGDGCVETRPFPRLGWRFPVVARWQPPSGPLGVGRPWGLALLRTGGPRQRAALWGVAARCQANAAFSQPCASTAGVPSGRLAGLVRHAALPSLSALAMLVGIGQA